MERLNREADCSAHQPKLSWREARRPQVDLGRYPGGITNLGGFSVHAPFGIELIAVEQMGDLQIGIERREDNRTTRFRSPSHAGEDLGVRIKGGPRCWPTTHPECALTDRKDQVELIGEWHGAGVEMFEGHAVRSVDARHLDKSLTDVDTVDDEPAPSEVVGMTPWPASDVENTSAGFERHSPEQFIHLSRGALGE